MQRTYRKDIDGIRAIAVMSVLLFHAGFSSFPGGYVGVDIFFVISGFLITGLIKAQVEAGSFRFGEFYARRVRRLFPALFVTVLLSFLLALLLFSAEHMERFAGEVIYAIGSLSNFYFWSESGYFDADAQFKPLLHTWSLSVEEQFYLFWPVMIVLFIRYLPGWRAVAMLALVGVLSFLGNLLVQDGDQELLESGKFLVSAFGDGGSTIYFLTPFRVFEFVIGGLLVWADRLRPSSNLAHELLLLLGLVLSIVPVFIYDEHLLFPSYYALMPCLGAALMIFSGQARYLGWVLRNPLSVRIGLISYSLYLVHWPIYVFYRSYVYGNLTMTEKFGIVAASFVLAIALYYLVEQRFRYQKREGNALTPVGFALAAALCSIAIMVPAATGWAKGGWPERAPQFVVNRNEVRCNSDDVCVMQKGNKGVVLLVGDSHMGHHMRTLLARFKGYTVHLFNTSSCYFGLEVRSQDHKPARSRQCQAANENLIQYLKQHAGKIDYIVQAQRWHGYLDRLVTLDGQKKAGSDAELYDVMLSDLVKLYKGQTAQKFVIGAAPNTAVGCLERPDFIDMPCRLAEENRSVRDVLSFKEASRSYVEHGFKFFHPVDALCKGMSCRQLVDNKKLYRDAHHLTREGSNLALRGLRIE